MEPQYKEIWLCKVFVLMNDDTEYEIKEEFVHVRVSIQELNQSEEIFHKIDEDRYKEFTKRIKKNSYNHFLIKRVKWIKKIGNTNYL
jgi:hypothetical protein